MTKIYAYQPDGDDFEHLLLGYPTIDAVQELDAKFNSTARLAPSWVQIWKPFTVTINSERPGPVADFPLLFGGPRIFSERAWRILNPLIGAEVEALPIAHPRGLHYAIHALSVLDALDREHSTIRWTPPDNRYIFDVEAHVWKQDVIKGHHMFRIPETAGLRIQVSEEFRNVVESNGLRGLIFRELR